MICFTLLSNNYLICCTFSWPSANVRKKICRHNKIEYYIDYCDKNFSEVLFFNFIFSINKWLQKNSFKHWARGVASSQCIPNSNEHAVLNLNLSCSNFLDLQWAPPLTMPLALGQSRSQALEFQGHFGLETSVRGTVFLVLFLSFAENASSYFCNPWTLRQFGVFAKESWSPIILKLRLFYGLRTTGQAVWICEKILY